jgi:hypothetical protein
MSTGTKPRPRSRGTRSPGGSRGRGTSYGLPHMRGRPSRRARHLMRLLRRCRDRAAAMHIVRELHAELHRSRSWGRRARRYAAYRAARWARGVYRTWRHGGNYTCGCHNREFRTVHEFNRHLEAEMRREAARDRSRADARAARARRTAGTSGRTAPGSGGRTAPGTAAPGGKTGPVDVAARARAARLRQKATRRWNRRRRIKARADRRHQRWLDRRKVTSRARRFAERRGWATPWPGARPRTRADYRRAFRRARSRARGWGRRLVPARVRRGARNLRRRVARWQEPSIKRAEARAAARRAAPPRSRQFTPRPPGRSRVNGARPVRTPRPRPVRVPRTPGARHARTRIPRTRVPRPRGRGFRLPRIRLPRIRAGR